MENLNENVPPVQHEEQKKTPTWIWGLLGLLGVAVAGLAALYFLNPKQVEKVITLNDTITQVVTVHDTVYVQQVEELEKDFNAAKFAQGKTDLTDDAKEVLFKLADLLKKKPDIKLKVVGHTSSEGSEDFNRRLSEGRAKATVDFLVSRGVEADRLSYEGKGASELIDPENPDANRRTEFIVFEDAPEANPEAAEEVSE